ncbi:unnamed protein product, partial [Coregonus sp. 'balchen']
MNFTSYGSEQTSDFGALCSLPAGSARPDGAANLDLLVHLVDLVHLVHLECAGPAGATDVDLEPLQASLVKLELAINYDFARRVANKYFVSHKRQGAFDDAVQFCTKRGLLLALPKNEEENTALTQVLEGAFNNVWLNVDNSKEGTFQLDLKGHPLTFSKWGDGEPKVPNGDRGCTMLTESGAWQVTSNCSFNAYIMFLTNSHPVQSWPSPTLSSPDQLPPCPDLALLVLHVRTVLAQSWLSPGSIPHLHSRPSPGSVPSLHVRTVPIQSWLGTIPACENSPSPGSVPSLHVRTVPAQSWLGTIPACENSPCSVLAQSWLYPTTACENSPSPVLAQSHPC